MNWDKLIYQLLGSSGRCLGSKSGYRMDNPTHVVYFNALVYINEKRVWCGDLDLTMDEENFMRFSRLHPTAEITILKESCERINGFTGEPTFNDYLLRFKAGSVQSTQDFSRKNGKLVN